MARSQMLVQHMRDEVTRFGVTEMTTPDAVDAFMATVQEGPALVFINSICGCAAGNARPALMLASEDAGFPERRGTVFAGQDPEATARLREHFSEVPPSSPCFFVLRDGKVTGHVPRGGIEGHTAEQVAVSLRSAFRDADAATAG